MVRVNLNTLNKKKLISKAKHYSPKGILRFTTPGQMISFYDNIFYYHPG